MSHIGNTEIGKMFFGDDEISKAYLGNTLVFKKGGGGLTPVYYDELVFDGTAYIQTDYLAPSQLSVLVELGDETLQAYQNVFEWRDVNGSILTAYGGATNSTRRQILPYYDSASYLVANKYLAFTYPRYTYFMTPNGFGWGNAFNTYSKGNSHPTTALLLGNGTDRPYTGTMKTFRVYGSDAAGATTSAQLETYTPVATFRPCTYNGEPGMWLVEQNKFFGNTAGSGTLSVKNNT